MLPDNHEILYSYDANGNLTSLIPPTKPAHAFDYNKVDLTTQYAPPILGMDTLDTRYEYNKDKEILKVIRPDGGVIETIYDSVGCSTCGSPVSRPKKILFASVSDTSAFGNRGELNFKYSQFTGNLDTLISPTDTLSYTYDGSLPTSVEWRGQVKGKVSVTYDNNMRVVSQSINDEHTINYEYDNDGLLTKVGEMTITREPATGRISGTTLGNITTSQSYNSLGELSGYEAMYNGSPLFVTSYVRDSLGRITQINETVDGKSEKKNYAYDIAGRLWKVWRNDTLISTYTYDPNGNRVARTSVRDGIAATDSGSYDAQDRLLTYSNSQYLYTRNGELRLKIDGTDTTSYTYDYFGNLITVILPNKDRIDYIIDGQNRRIGKKLNGIIVKRWIYSGQLTPIAELDSVGNVVAQFVGNYMIKNGNTYQLITDHLGSIRLVVDVETGTVMQRLDYDEFGNVTYDSNPDFTPFAFGGGLNDIDTRLVHFGARDYNPECGRWNSRYPIGFNGGDLNLFVYAANDPINFIDPTGSFIGIVDYRSNQQAQQISSIYISEAGQLGNAWVDVVREVALYAGMVALAISLPGSTDEEVQEQNDNPWVVRCGAMAPPDYFRIDVDEISPTGYGFSVQYKPGTSLKKLVVLHLSSKYNKVNVTTKGAVKMLQKAFPEVDVIETPEKGNPYYGTFVTKKVYNPYEAAAIRSIFQQLDLKQRGWK